LETDPEVGKPVDIAGYGGWRVGRLRVVVIVGEDGNLCWLDARGWANGGYVSKSVSQGGFYEGVSR